MSKGRVLVIDDDEWVCRLLSVAMNEAGFQVTITENAAQGFYRAVEDQPDCIVCDVDLPDHNGYWVARKIRSHPTKVAVVPIVFLSGLDDREHRLEGFQVGGDAYLTKPFRIDEVVAQVDALIQMAARLRQARQTIASIPPSAHAMVGNLAQMSVATVLTLLDLERRSGKLEVSSDSRKAVFVVHGGTITETTIGDLSVAPIDSLRTVMGWETGKFAFTPAPHAPHPEGTEPVPINALLMEAARLEDEARASDASSERPSSARLAWRESVRRTSTPPRERDTNPPSSMQSAETYMPPPDTYVPPDADTYVPGPPSSSGPMSEVPFSDAPLSVVPVSETPLSEVPVSVVPVSVSPITEQPSPSPMPGPTFGRPPVPPPPPSSLKPLLPPAVTPPAGRAFTSSPAINPLPQTPVRAPVVPKPPMTPTGTGTSPRPGLVTRPTKPSMPIPKTAFGAPMRSLSPTKVKAVVPPPPPSKPPQRLPKEGDAVDSGWSVPPPPPPADESPSNAATVIPQADETPKPEPVRVAPIPPRPQRAGQGGGEG